VTPSADDLVEQARRRIERTRPSDLEAVVSDGGLVVDIRPAAQRGEEGELPGALVIERNVLEWRLDPEGSHRLPEATGFDRPVSWCARKDTRPRWPPTRCGSSATTGRPT